MPREQPANFQQHDCERSQGLARELKRAVAAVVQLHHVCAGHEQSAHALDTARVARSHLVQFDHS
jgi:hypothetical protein